MLLEKNSIDRRRARTQTMLQHALLSLIRRKRYETITIKDICKAANVGRSTFYAHYTSKDDLKRDGLEHLRTVLIDRQREAVARSDSHRPFGFSLALFEHARDHLDLYRALVGDRGGIVALGKIRAMLADLVREELVATAGKRAGDTIPSELVIQYIVGAYMAVLTWWLDGGATLPPDQVDAMFRRLATEGTVPSDP